MSVSTALTAIGNKIRNILGVTTKYKLEAMPAAIGAVYDQGKLAEYNRFWNDFQQNGKRYNYSYAFAGFGWTDLTCRPLYELKIPDGVSGTLNINYAFYYNQGITATPPIVSTTNVAWSGTFTQAKNIETINVSGIIGSDFDVKNLTKISAQSIYDIVQCLDKTKSKTITFNAAAVQNWYTQKYKDSNGSVIYNSDIFSSAEEAWQDLERMAETWRFVV